MSEITRDTVAHLAQLAHIEMSEQQLQDMAGELRQIVTAVADISDVVGEDIPATSHPLPLRNVMRKDVVGEPLTVEDALSGAPDAEDGQFKVPAILDED